jgi:lysophospholipase L1-like esterase
MLFADDTGNLADTVIDNIVNNHFTTPDSHLIFRVRQNEEQTPMFKKIGINALGFRGRLISERKGGIRILILGDSCAYGWGITDIAETFPGRLEKLLAARGIPTEIYNLSQPGYSTTQGLILYREWQPIIKPDVLILYFGWNDIWNSPKLTDRQTISLLRVVNQPFITAILSSRITSVLRAVLHPFTNNIIIKQRDALTTRNDALPVRVPINEAIENYREMSSRGLVLIVLPPFDHSHTDLMRMAEYKEAVGKNLSASATIIEIPEMEGPKAVDYFRRDGYHPNQTGAAVIASSLADSLEKCRKNR